MATALRDLPKYLVLNPVSTVRIEMRLESPACEIDVELDNPRPGRSFVLLIGQTGGPYVQRVRLAGRARIYFDPQAPGPYELLLANPQREPLVLRLRGRDIPATVRRAPGKRPRPVLRPRTVPSESAVSRRHRSARRRASPSHRTEAKA
ncbi:MAG: hypothetical protein WB947_00860 [Thermoplasmata archaeon]